MIQNSEGGCIFLLQLERLTTHFVLKITGFLGTNYNLVVYSETKSSPPVVHPQHTISAKQLTIKSDFSVFLVVFDAVFKHKEYSHAVNGCVIYLNLSLLL